MSKLKENEGIESTPLDTEVWYRVEVSMADSDDWSVCHSYMFDRMITAKSWSDRHEVDGDYRIVRVTTVTEAVRYA